MGDYSPKKLDRDAVTQTVRKLLWQQSDMAVEDIPERVCHWNEHYYDLLYNSVGVDLGKGFRAAAESVGAPATGINPEYERIKWIYSRVARTPTGLKLLNKAEELEVRVRFDSQLDANIYGNYCAGEKTIALNPIFSDQRLVFTLAHALGHLEHVSRGLNDAIALSAAEMVLRFRLMETYANTVVMQCFGELVESDEAWAKQGLAELRFNWNEDATVGLLVYRQLYPESLANGDFARLAFDFISLGEASQQQSEQHYLRQLAEATTGIAGPFVDFIHAAGLLIKGHDKQSWHQECAPLTPEFVESLTRQASVPDFLAGKGAEVLAEDSPLVRIDNPDTIRKVARIDGCFRMPISRAVIKKFFGKPPAG